MKHQAVFFCIGIQAVIIVWFLFCDYALERMSFGLLRALVDNLCHASVCGLLWLSVICRQISKTNSVPNNVASIGALNHVFSLNNRFCSYTISLPFWFVEVIIASSIGSGIDVDHFIEAQSFSFFKATQLPHRPFAHNILFCIGVVVATQLIFHRMRHTVLVGCSLLTHLLRDSTRRGLWCWPLGSTVPLTLIQVFTSYLMLSACCTVIVFGDYKKCFTRKIAKTEQIAASVDIV